MVTTVVPILVELALNPSYMDTLPLVAIYSPYFGIPLLILVDSYQRVSSRLNLKIKET